MDLQFQAGGPDNWQASIILAFGCEKENILEENPELDKACPWAAVSPALRDFHGKEGELTLCHGHPDLKIPRLLAIGLGKRGDVDAGCLRGALGKALKKIRGMGLESVLLPEPFVARMPGGTERLLQECVCAAYLSLYRFTRFKTHVDDLQPDPKTLAIAFMGDSVSEGTEQASRRGEMDAWAVNMARDLDNMPSNLLYPEALALKAHELANQYGFNCQILDESRLDSEGMACLLAVGSGSCHPPRLIVCEHAPEGFEQEKPLIYIGKGITFDSGGLCIKPAANMYQMKCDMSGAAAVLSAMAALAREGAPRRIVAILACAENMPDGKAYRPGDILNSASGDTVEVINTDAEGRLVLCDALAYAQKNWTPAGMIDIATLTGACAVALGNQLGGLFCEDEELASRIVSFGSITGENFWRLPLWRPYAKNLKSKVADICHTASREGGAITAALFLAHFVQDGQLWAHLDIAGVDWQKHDSDLCPEGASGFGTRVLVELGRGGLA